MNPPLGLWVHRPLFHYGEVGGFGHGWVASHGADPIGPVRMFQWEAIADLPAEHVRPGPLRGHYEAREPYGVALVLPPWREARA